MDDGDGCGGGDGGESLQNNIVVLYDIEQKKRASSFEIRMQFSVVCWY